MVQIPLIVTGWAGSSQWDSLLENEIKMKYTLEGFSQEAALSMRATVTENGHTKTIKLDLTDLTILRWIVDFYPNMKKIYVEGTEYMWLDYSAFVEDMPLLGLSNQSLYKRCMKMVQLGVLKHKTVRSKGTFSYYGFGPEYSRLVGNTRTPAQAPTPTRDPLGDTTNLDATQSRTPEPQPLFNEPQNPAQPKEPDHTEEVVDYLNKRAGTHYKATTSSTRRLIKARLKEGFTVEEIKLVIDKKCADWLNNPRMAEFLRPETLFGSKFESYLNTKSSQRTGYQQQQSSQSNADEYLRLNAQYLDSDEGWL